MKSVHSSIFRWVPELVSLSLFGVNLLLSFVNSIFAFDKPVKKRGNLPPVIIFEHWVSKNYWHILMKRYLERAGFTVYWTNYSLRDGGAEKGARYLKKFIAKNKIKDAVLVGISMGAISSYVYLQRLGGWSNIRKFISISGPFKGAPLAFAPTPLAETDDIKPDSEFIKKLIKEPVKNPDKIVNIAALSDEIVPQSSSFLKVAKNKIVGVHGHNFLHMFSKEVFETIVREAHN